MKSGTGAVNLRHPFVQNALAVLAVLLTAACARAVDLHLDKASMGLIYILIVALSAALGGTRPALFAAFTSFFVLNYISIQPFYTFFIHDPKDILLLTVFLVIGILIGQIMGRMRSREEEALARERDAGVLYKAILSMNTRIDLREALQAVGDQVMAGTHAKGCALFLEPFGEDMKPSALSGSIDRPALDTISGVARWAARSSKAVGLCPPPSSEESAIPWPPSVPYDKVSIEDLPDTPPGEPPALPSETQALPSEPPAPPSETQAPPSETQAPPSETQALPSETQALPSETQALPSETQAPPSETQALPSETQALPGETQAPPNKPQPPPGVFIPLHSGPHTAGVLFAAPSAGESFSPSDCRILVALASSCGAFLERKRLMAEAARAETLRETERLKSLLLSSFSHNLKTPLSSLAATISSLRQGDIEWEPDASRELLSQMEEDIERLTEHIGNLIELAHLESGTRKPQQEGLELREIVSMAVRRLPQRSYERLTIALPEDLPLVWVDGVQLSQVVRHVLENAVDYSTPDSAVTLEAAPAAESVRFWVDDAGPGIAEEEKDKIFQRFYRGKAASEKAIRGTGLGLAICREILQANEGSITVEPSPRGGARFVITVPSRASSEQR